MGKKLTAAVGIDIGSHTIKVVELRSRGGEAEVTAVGIVETPEGAVDHTGVYNSDEVGDALKGLLRSSEIKTQPVVLSLAGQASVLVRTLDVPRMTPAELKEHMQWEINRNIPFVESNVLSDYQVLPEEDPNSANIEVVMAIAPESAIETMLACTKRAGRHAVGIDVEPLALARSLEYSHGDEYRDQTVCVVEMGGKTTAINIYRNGKLLMPRQIPIGGEMLTKAIADTYMIAIPDAEKLKRESATIPEAEIQAAAQSGGFAPTFGLDDAGSTQSFSAYNPFSDQPLPPNPFLDPEGGDAPPDAAFNPFAEAPPAPPAAPVGGAPFNPFADPPPAPSPITSAPTPSVAPFNPFAEAPPLPGIDEPAPPAVAPAEVAAEGPPPIEPSAGFNPFSDEPAPLAPSADGDTAAIVPTDAETARLFSSLRPVLEEFVAEVRRSVDYFKSRGGDVNRIVLCGGGTRLNGLDRYIGASLQIECAPYDPLRNLRINEKRVTMEFLEDSRAELTVALGTALHILFD